MNPFKPAKPIHLCCQFCQVPKPDVKRMFDPKMGRWVTICGRCTIGLDTGPLKTER